MALTVLLALLAGGCAGKQGAGVGGNAGLAQDHLQSADLAMSQGRPADAAKLYADALRADPTSGPAYMGRGKASYETGNYEQSLADFSRAIEYGGGPQALVGRAAALIALNRTGEAMTDLQKAIALRPDLPEAHNNLGLVLASMGQTDASIRELDLAIQHSGGRMADAYYNRGAMRQHAGQISLAMADYDACILLDPKNVRAYNNRGLLNLKSKQPQAALADLNRAVELNPADAGSYFNRAMAQEELNAYAEAIQDYTKAIGINPRMAEAYHNRGILHMRMASRHLACQDYEAACKLGLCRRLENSKSLGLCW